MMMGQNYMKFNSSDKLITIVDSTVATKIDYTLSN